MTILDDISQIRKLDKSSLLASIEQLWLQLKQTHDEINRLKIPANYHNVKRVVINGIGGSAFGGKVAERLFENSLEIPIINLSSYFLPPFVDSETLLILSSYSGDTEEILETTKEGLRRKAKILVFAQNGKLAKWAFEENLPGFYGFAPIYNPCGKPRMALGYQILGIILLLAKCNFLDISNPEISGLLDFLKQVNGRYGINVPAEENLAKKLAIELHSYIPIIVGSEFTLGSIHALRNQIHENSKQFSVYFEIPELNHHLLEGLMFPDEIRKFLFFIFVESNLYYARNHRRIQVTKEVLDKYKIKYESIRLTGETRLKQVFELIQLGSYISYYLAILNKLDPTPIPWVDYFKTQLERFGEENLAAHEEKK